MLTNPGCHSNTCIAAIRYDQQAILSYLIHITCRENSYSRKTEGLLPLRLKDATIVRQGGEVEREEFIRHCRGDIETFPVKELNEETIIFLIFLGRLYKVADMT